MPLTKGGPHNRVSSPCGGGSTFTTVAPISAISIVHIGPERIRDRSRTKISSSGVMQAARPSATAVEVSGTDSSVVVLDRKSTRLNSSHSQISYAVFCLKKKKTQ